MIIRRRHTANFTTIGNALFEDERLAADEVGILAYLLSRPHDWEVRRPALMRRWRIGSAGLKRIVDNLMRAGWCRAEKRRLPNGTFDVVYEIRDEPGPSLTEDEIRRALSLVSSEAEADESGQAPEDREPPGGGDPPPCQPGVAEPLLADHHVVDIKGLNTELPRDESNQKVEREGRVGYDRKAAFIAAFEARWPTAATDDRARVAKACRELPDDEEPAALQFIGSFLEKLKAAGRKYPPAGWKYIESRPWTLDQAKPVEGKNPHHGGPYDPASETGRALLVLLRIGHSSLPRLGDGRLIYVRPITPQLLALAGAPEEGTVYPIGSQNFGAWREFLRAHLTNLPALSEIAAPWPWPPRKDGTPAATGPPGALASDQDLRDFAEMA